MKKAISASIIAAGVWLAVGCGSSQKPSGNWPIVDAPPSREPAFRISATTLAQEAIADPKAAEAKYRGKFIEVDGRIDLANKVIGDSRMVSLIGVRKGLHDENAVRIMCLSMPDQRAKMWWLSKGQKVKVVGRVSNISSMAVYLEDCTFTEQEPNPTLTVSAEQLAGEFAKDANAAKKKYGSEVIITGTVAKLTQTKEGFFGVQLTGTDRVAVDCRLKKEDWQALKNGEKVTIKGDNATFDTQQNAVIINNAFVLKKD